MRSTIVPAQITTVEDKIFGSISVNQTLLLGAPLLTGFALTILAPPNGQFVGYKVVASVILFATCGVLALRIRGLIVAQWLSIFIKYSSRPRYFVYDKNSNYLREVLVEAPKNTENTPESQSAKNPLTTTNLSSGEFIKLQTLMSSRNAELKFEVGKRGELNVRVTENQ